jgi:hypothetical protein
MVFIKNVLPNFIFNGALTQQNRAAICYAVEGRIVASGKQYFAPQRNKFSTRSSMDDVRHNDAA